MSNEVYAFALKNTLNEIKNVCPDVSNTFIFKDNKLVAKDETTTEENINQTINAFEAGAELTPESVSTFSLEHPRCGTAFLLTLVLFSILAFTIIGPLPIFWRLVSRILLIPVLAGVSLEYIRWTANHLSNPIVRILIKPNLALQSLTTREPDMSMLEVAIESFNTMRQAEQEFSL